MFSKKSNIIAQDFYNNDAIQSDFIQIKKEIVLLNLDLISYKLKVENNVKTVTINSDNGYISYYVGLYPLTDTFIYNSTFIFNISDISEYYVCINYNNKIIILGIIKLI